MAQFPIRKIPKDIQNFLKLYAAARREIIKVLTEKESSTGIIAVYERELLEQIDREIKDLNRKSIVAGSKLIEEYYKTGMESAVEEFERKGIYVNSSFSQIHLEAVNELIQNLSDNLTDANYFIGRKIQDNIRDAGLKAAALKLTAGKTSVEMQSILKQNFIIQGLNGFTDKSGRAWQLDAYAAMVIRSTTREATNSGTLNEVKQANRDLVKMSEHGSSCPICRDFEGRVFSISGNDKRFPPLSDAFSGGYQNIHPNCKHVVTPYIEEFENVKNDILFSKRPYMPEDELKRQMKTYNRQNKKVKELRDDARQYEKFRALLKSTPELKTFELFRKAKKNPGEYQVLKSRYNSALNRMREKAVY